MPRFIDECIAIPWSYCPPFFYGDYEGRLINGKDCKIDVSNKIKVYDIDNNRCGSDEIDIWYCNALHVSGLIETIKEQRG
jgi:hypothetical protein